MLPADLREENRGASSRALPDTAADSFLFPSPFEVQVSPEAGAQKVRAWGPGLETGQVGKSADFVVEAIGTEVGTLGKCLSSVRDVTYACC